MSESANQSGASWLRTAQALTRAERLPVTRVEELLDYALNEAIRLSESSYGYIYFYDEDRELFVNYAWSTDVMEQCRIVKRKTTYELETTGLWGEVVRQRKTMVANDYAGECPLKRGLPNGHVPLTRWMSVPVVIDGRIVAVAGVANKYSDYTDEDAACLSTLLEAIWSMAERLRLRNELLEERRRVRALTAEVALAGERERSRLAVRVHDEVGQPLAAALMHLHAASADSSADSSEISTAVQLVQAALGQTRSVITVLSPRILDEMGLAPALEWLALEAVREDLTCTVSSRGDASALTEAQRLLAFSTARELLYNVIEHSGVAKAELAWSCTTELFELTVSDEGCGMCPDETSLSGVDMLLLAERAEHMGGSLRHESSPGRGTSATLLLPLHF